MMVLVTVEVRVSDEEGGESDAWMVTKRACGQ